MISETLQKIIGFSILGKAFKINRWSKVTLNEAGFAVKYGTETVSVNIGIGKDHTALLVMPKAAWDALNSGEKVSAITLKDFKKGMHLPKKTE